MSHAVTAWAVLTLICAVLAILAVWARRPTGARPLSVLCLVVSLPITALAVSAPMGWAVPMMPLTAPGGEYRVAGLKMVLGEGIYVLLDIGPGEPRHYRLPWDQEQAKKLQEMLDDPANGGVKLKIPYEKSWEKNPTFHPLPQPQLLPDKPPQEPAIEYEGRAA